MMTENKNRIIYLLERYTERTATVPELQELTTWMAEQTDDTPMQEHLQRLMDQPEADLNHVNWEQVYAGIMEGLNETGTATISAHNKLPIQKVHFMRKWGWAAAVLVIVGLGSGYFWWNSHKNKAQEAQTIASTQQDISPGTNKAILILADGSNIVLDSAANGYLATQGGMQLIKLSDGSIKYNTVNPGTAPKATMQYNTIRTPRGGQYQLILQDGSKVWLNAASSIRYPVAFSSEERTVEIDGEAYFEINQNKNAPFYVRANGTEVKVLGTTFNINAYKDEDAVTTTLLSGSVLIRPLPHSETALSSNTNDKDATTPRHENSNSVILQPGEQAYMNKNNKQKIVIKIPDTNEVIAWKNNLFQFNEANIEVIMRQLARWYNVDVSFKGAIPTTTFRGKISRNVNISQVLKILEFSDVHFSIEGNKITVMP